MSDVQGFRVNPVLKAQDHAGIFRRDGVVQIGDILEPAAPSVSRRHEKRTPPGRSLTPTKREVAGH
jgi:hypothetical protein